MKQIRLAAIVAVVAVSGFAVSNANASKHRDLQTWYRQLNAPVDVQSSYILATGSEPCSGSAVICKIEDEPSASNPNIPAFSFGAPSTHELQYNAVKRASN